MAGDFGFEPTKAERDYYFISYNSADQDRVAPIVRKLNEYGLPIWYDKGIPSATDWDEYIADKIEKCSEVILFMSKEVLAKKGTYVRLEYELATEDYEKKVHIVWMDDIQNQDVPKWSKLWWKRIQRIQGINITRVSETEKQVALICRALGVETNRVFSDVPPNMRQGETAKITKNLPNLEKYFGENEDNSQRKIKPRANVMPETAVKSETEKPIEEEPIVELPVRYSEGLEFEKMVDGTYTVFGMGACHDTELVIPPTTPDGGKVTKVFTFAFSHDSRLESIYFPVSVISISGILFNGCSSLTSIAVHPNNPVYYSQDNCIIERKTNQLVAGIKTSKIPQGVTSIADHAFGGCSGLASITIPADVTSIGKEAFYGCSGLTFITIPTGVTSIGCWAFADCRSLTSIRIPISVTSIGEGTFASCSGLKSIYLSTGLDSIGFGAFYACSGLTSITIPKGVTSIGEEAFADCSGLASVTIPNGVVSIGRWAFYACKSATIYCEHPSQPATWDENWNPDNRPVVWNYKPENK